MAKSRLIGSYPVIGIRPTIDGRRGALDGPSPISLFVT